MKSKRLIVRIISAIICIAVVAVLIATCYANVTPPTREKTRIEAIKELQDALHETADLFRAHGYEDTSAEIYDLKYNWHKLDNELYYLQNYEPTHTTAYVKTNEPFESTYLTAEELDTMLIDTELYGYGYAFAKMEADYGVNAVYAISVMCLESGYGEYPLPGYNYFGLTNCKFSSIDSCIMYFGELLSSDLYYGKDLYGIASIYCPVNPKYVSDIQWLMNSRWDLLSVGG